jgi:3-dehydroquinate dehydratase/shikimate dehydrogenase
MALVCETVTADSMAGLVAARDRVVDADLVELRLDGIADVDVDRALDGRRHPVVVTCRPTWEGGRFTGAEAERLAILARAFTAGAEYVDVEWKADRRSLPPRHESRLVLSHHDHDGMPADLADRVRAMRSEHPAVVKVAVTAARVRDCLALRSAVAGSEGHGGNGRHEAHDRTDGRDRHVAIAMGQAGHLTRAFPALTGSCWMYGGSAAPGQLSAADLVQRFRVRKVSLASRVFAIVGAPLGHSASPAMHNAAFDALGIDAVYLAIDTPDADECLEVAGALSLEGASVTAPLKRPLAGRCESTDEVAAAVGAINTLKRSARGWDGRNFDVAGFIAPLDGAGARGVATASHRSCALVLGAGGAARSAAWALVRRGADVTVSARRDDVARQVAADVGAVAAPWPPDPSAFDLVVNATPVGAWPHAGRSPLSSAVRGTAYDLVYNPAETMFLADARRAGARTIGGLGMLIEQAARQFEWWTTQPAPRDVLAGAARQFLESLKS